MKLDLIDKLAGWWLDWRTGRELAKDSELRQFNLKKYEETPDGYNILAIAPAVAIIADQAAELLEVNNAKNYIQFDMQPRLDRGLRPIRITVQWAGGEMPAAKAARLERELELLTKALDAGDATPLLQRCLAALRFTGKEIDPSQ